MTLQSLRHLVLPTPGLVAVLVFVAPPTAAFASTLERTSGAAGGRHLVSLGPVLAARAADGRLPRSRYGADITRSG